ncbi:MAG: ABC transporter permease, partial [Anaerolineaceae bacterium]|nr:ABC transporter permease [Anaerolineaceae bacterium]
VKVRYKQTALGAAWAILQPLLTMVVFSVIFGRLAGLPSEGIPYPIFTYTALLPWQLFSHALSDSSNSLVGNERLITKVYFPRLVIPISSVLGGLVDFALAFVVLLGMMLFYGVQFTWRLLALPPLVLLAIITATAIGLWFSALNVQYRDVRYTVPFLTQLWMYATPIAYSSTIIPENWRWVLGLNPLAGVVEGFRWALLGRDMDASGLIVISIIIVLLLLFGGLVYFKRMEDTFADVI